MTDGNREMRTGEIERLEQLLEEAQFVLQEVEVTVSANDLRGRPLNLVRCEICGEWVQDDGKLEDTGKTMRRSCGGQRYWRIVSPGTDK